MTGYVMAFGRCCGCDLPMTFHPNKVPSLRVNGEREPVCRACMDALNADLEQNGLPPHAIDPEAYKACAEHDL